VTVIAQLADGRQLHFPDGTDPGVVQATVKKVLGPGAAPSQPMPSAAQQVQNDAITKGAQDVLSTTPAELISANPVVRMLTAAARPVLGAAALMEAPFGGHSNLDRMAELDAMQKRGAEQLGFPGYAQTAQDIAGTLVGPVSGIATKAGPAVTALEKMAQGGATGALVGETMSPAHPLEGAAVGGVTGAAIPAGISVSAGLTRAVKRLADLFRGGKGANNVLMRYITAAVGEDNMPSVIAALRKHGIEPLPGYKPTAAEAVAGTPEGSPLLAHQRITASTKGGPSAAFGHRVIDQKAAVQAAQEARDAIVVPQLKDSLKVADQNGIKTNDIVSGIDEILAQPGFRASTVVSKTLGAVKEKLDSLSQNGVVNGEDLWTLRKEVGNTIKGYAKEANNWDKRLTSGLERRVQGFIDNAIVKAGATEWPKQIGEYAARSQAIQDVKNAAKTALRPAQKTDLFGGLRVAEETRTHIPQMLSRPMMAANAVLRYVSSGIEPKIDARAAHLYLNPLEFADALSKLPSDKQNAAIEMLKRVGAANAVAAEVQQAEQARQQGQ